MPKQFFAIAFGCTRYEPIIFDNSSKIEIIINNCNKKYGIDLSSYPLYKEGIDDNNVNDEDDDYNEYFDILDKDKLERNNISVQDGYLYKIDIKHNHLIWNRWNYLFGKNGVVINCNYSDYCMLDRGFIQIYELKSNKKLIDILAGIKSAFN